jgi:hypothetical protein
VISDDAPPFFNDVLQWRAGTLATELCVARLREIETRHRVNLIAPGLPYEIADGRLVVRGDPRFEHLEDPSDRLLLILLRDQLFPFLDETWGILFSAYPDDSDIIFDGRYFFHGTARAYAAVAAEWACRARWNNREDWGYAEFLYGQSLDPSLLRWLEQLYSLVTEKSRPSAR